jgi:hypothetical protein
MRSVSTKLLPAARAKAAELLAAATAVSTAGARPASVVLDGLRARADPVLLRLVQVLREADAARRVKLQSRVVRELLGLLQEKYVERSRYVLLQNGKASRTPELVDALEGRIRDGTRCEPDLSVLRREVLGLGGTEEEEKGRARGVEFDWIRALAWRCRGGQGSLGEVTLLRHCFLSDDAAGKLPVLSVTAAEAKGVAKFGIDSGQLLTDAHAVLAHFPITPTNPFQDPSQAYSAVLWEAWHDPATGEYSASRVWDVLYGPVGDGSGAAVPVLPVLKRYGRALIKLCEQSVAYLLKHFRNVICHLDEEGEEADDRDDRVAKEDDEDIHADIYFAFRGHFAFYVRRIVEGVPTLEATSTSPGP